jgi:hypothetical protein
MQISKQLIRQMSPRQVHTIPCQDMAELNTTYETVKQVRRELIENDAEIRIAASKSEKTMTVVIRAELYDRTKSTAT